MDGWIGEVYDHLLSRAPKGSEFSKTPSRFERASGREEYTYVALLDYRAKSFGKRLS